MKAYFFLTIKGQLEICSINDTGFPSVKHLEDYVVTATIGRNMGDHILASHALSQQWYT